MDGKKSYEALIVTVPVLNDDEYKGMLEYFADFIKQEEGEIVEKVDLKIKELANEMPHLFKNEKVKWKTGRYLFIEFKILPKKISRIRDVISREQNVIRNLILTLPKDGVLFNENRRNSKKSKERGTDIDFVKTIVK